MVISYGFTSKNGDRNKHILWGYWYLFTSNGLISMGCHPGDRPQLVDLRVASSEVENLHQEWRFVWKIIELNLVGGWAYPSEKWWSSPVGMMKFPIYGKTSSKPPTSNGSMGDLQLQRLPRFFFPPVRALFGHFNIWNPACLTKPSSNNACLFGWTNHIPRAAKAVYIF